MLQFFWKVLRRYIEDASEGPEGREARAVWANLKDKQPSLTVFTNVFQSRALRKPLWRLFKSGALLREVVCSGVSMQLKSCYLRHVDTLKRGFL
jgi:hypothetical protein